MKAVILAGGLGSRIGEESYLKPKPMIEIGGKPVIWHILKTYSAHGINDFIICLGYRGYVIKEYFTNYFLHTSDATFDLGRNSIEVHERHAEPWRVTLVNTGDETMTGGRLKRVMPYLKDEETFCFTYGDSVGDIDIAGAIEFHRNHGKMATVTSVRPPSRYGALECRGTQITGFSNKTPAEAGAIIGGYFVLSSGVFDLLEGDQTSWEGEPLARLARQGEIMAYEHQGFWQPVDTMRDKNLLDDLWNTNRAPWKVW